MFSSLAATFNFGILVVFYVLAILGPFIARWARLRTPLLVGNRDSGHAAHAHQAASPSS